MNEPLDITPGLDELRAARRESRPLFWAVGGFSTFVNLLMLTGPLFMLQVYDRVLGSQSVETLLALTLLMVFLYGIMGLLDGVRGRILARIGARFDARMGRRVFSAMLQYGITGRRPIRSEMATQDLNSIQRLMSSPALAALFDLPWTPVFLAGIALFHPLLGGLAMIGGGVLIALTLINTWVTKRPNEAVVRKAYLATNWGNLIRLEAETVQCLGMRNAAFDRWQAAKNEAAQETLKLSDRGGGFSVAIRTWRLFLQSAMLALGAYLVLQSELGPGAMIASTVLLGRALAPVELLVGQWSIVDQGRQGWRSLAELLSLIDEKPLPMELPKPKPHLEVNQLTVMPPGEQQATLRMVSFALVPGQALGVIGQSGSGKSTLARALTGLWPPAAGSIQLDGATLDQYDPDVLGRSIGYLPQIVRLFDGTIAENIARLDPNAKASDIVAAATKAAAHRMILALPEGYDTPLSSIEGRLSGGQIQRIGLARAFFGNPVLLVLDEPNSSLDNEGSNALNLAIRQAKADGQSVMIMAHRPAAIQECDMLLMLDGGMRKAFGPKSEVLKTVVQNFKQIERADLGGVA